MKPTATPVPCFTSAAATAFYRLLTTDTRQQHPSLVCDARLVQAAQRRAASQYGAGLSHCDALGVCANDYARAAGCQLPSFYAANGNNIESLTAGTANPLAAFESLARSPSHSRHLFGQNLFFREQDKIGIALVEVPSHRYRYIWAILIARCDTLSSSKGGGVLTQ
jgi:hypothetical protein